ncbi:MAG: hypothetical protein AAGG07_04995 [Planctomycetota bacterium]
MFEFFFGGQAAWFSVPAVLGSLFFVLQFVVGELGGNAELDLDAVGDTPSAEFRVFSLQTIAAFAMGSGWIGLGAYQFLELSFTGSVVVSAIGGFVIAWVLTAITRAALKLQSSGNIALDSTIGHIGTVYVQVPPSGEGAGRVTLVVDRRQREFNAVQRGDEPIASKRSVRVVEIEKQSNTVVVEMQG